MPKCTECKKLDAAETWRDRLTSWILNHVFPQTLKDEKTGARLEGFTEGYRLSGKQGQELQQVHFQMDKLEFQINQLILQIIKDKFPNV